MNYTQLTKTALRIFLGFLGLTAVIAAMWIEVEAEVYYRFMAAVGIVVGLETVSLPILIKLSKGAPHTRERLLLEQLEDDIYIDSSGKRFQLKAL